jgi:hypothetical protein
MKMKTYYLSFMTYTLTWLHLCPVALSGTLVHTATCKSFLNPRKPWPTTPPMGQKTWLLTPQ